MPTILKRLAAGQSDAPAGTLFVVYTAPPATRAMIRQIICRYKADPGVGAPMMVHHRIGGVDYEIGRLITPRAFANSLRAGSLDGDAVNTQNKSDALAMILEPGESLVLKFAAGDSTYEPYWIIYGAEIT